jgi:hypothetical protein
MAARPSVVCIEGGLASPAPEVVGQKDLDDLLTAQSAAWGAAKRAAKLSERVMAALERGATVEPGPLKFDRDYECVAITCEALDFHVSR